MESKIRAYIDNAFAGAPQTKKTLDLKEELFANMCEKYSDQLKNGKTEQQAYDYVLVGIGDINELVESVKEPYPLAPPSPAEIKKRALLTSCAVALYILSPTMVIIFPTFFNQGTLGVIMMFALIAAATGLLVYNDMTKPKYHKIDNTVVEEFKEWRVANERERQAYASFKGAFWSIVVAVYLLSSFMLGIWAYSWIIFIIAVAVENVIKGIMHLREGKNE